MKANEIASQNSISSSIKLLLIVSAFANLLLLLPHDSLAAVSTTITGDGTLGTTVNGQPLTLCTANCSISGGTLKGASQFHSFDTFSVGAGDVATFNVPGGVTHILSRVTGLQSGISASMLYGAVEATTPVNFFFMNPAGIVFGPNAQLNVGSSVNFTTANYIRLFDGVNSAMFYANPASDAVTTAGKVSILSSAPLPEFGFVPAAFGFLDGNSAGITVLPGSTLSVPAGGDLTLVAGNKEFTYKDPDTENPMTAAGGIQVRGGFLSAPAGEIRLASVASPGEILLPNLQTGPNINGQSFSTMGTIALAEGAFLDVSDNAFEAGGAGGTIRIRGGQLVMDSAGIFSITQGDVNGAPTAIDINVSGDVAPGEFALSLNNFSAIASQTSGKGRGGDIVIIAGTDTKPGSVDVAGSSTIVTFTSGDGRAGDISVTTHGAGTLSIHGTDGVGNLSNIESITDGSTRVIRSGDSGNISITAGSVSVGSIDLHEPGYIRTTTQTDGNAGNVDLHADNVRLGAGGFIETRGAAQGATGLLTVTATDMVSLTGDPLLNIAQQSALRNTQLGTGAGKGISVSARNIQITDGAQIVNKSNTSSGPVDISASDSILISGKSQIENQAFSGAIGDIHLSATKTITLSDQAVLRGSTIGSATGGTIGLTGESISLSGQSVVTSRTASTGQAGQIRLTASDSVSLSSGSIVTTSSLDPATGTGGSVTITAGNQIALMDPGTKVLSETNGRGNGGNITLTSGNMTSLTSGATISANSTSTAPGAGNAGKIAINAGRTFFAQDSFVTTKSVNAGGGNIDIFATDLIRLVNSQVSASARLNGGNILIDPNSVILQNSQIQANAIDGNGGNITIVTPVFLMDQNSTVSASSQFGQSGTINIQSPTSDLSGTVSSLPSSMRQAQSLQTGRCAALANSRSSSLIVAGRDAMPTEPGGWLPSPFALTTGEDGGPFVQPAAYSTPLLASAEETVSLRRLTPAGFLTQHFAESESTGCRS